MAMTQKRRRYVVHAVVGVSAYTYVEAETPEEAVRLAEGRMAIIDTGYSGANPHEEFIIEDADGTPYELSCDGSTTSSPEDHE